jgi:hypothetical protein
VWVFFLPSLKKRGEGRFYKSKEAFVLKIPLHPPFPKGDKYKSIP